ncbi:hypothetical protein HYC85_016516, partial [Camellia sinensis]
VQRSPNHISSSAKKPFATISKERTENLILISIHASFCDFLRGFWNLCEYRFRLYIEMSRPQDPHRTFFPFGNPFKMMLPKGSYLSPRLLELLNNFEDALAERFRKLKPKDREEVLSLSWMALAMELLCQTHTDIKSIITKLELPVYDWDDKWIDLYLDNTVKLLDICIVFSSELSRLNQGHVLLHCALHNLDASPSNQFVKACSSLDGWRQHISSKNRRLENCFGILDSLTVTLNLPKVKKSAKGKVLMRAMYGVKVVTVFVCSIFAAAFSGSANKLVDLQVLESCLWAESFVDVQTYVNGEIRNIFSSGRVTVLKELEAVDTSVKKLYPTIQDGVGPIEVDALQNCTSDLGKRADMLSQGLDLLAKQVDGFFQIVLTGRDALLCNLRVDGGVPDPMRETDNVEGRVVSFFFPAGIFARLSTGKCWLMASLCFLSATTRHHFSPPSSATTTHRQPPPPIHSTPLSTPRYHHPLAIHPPLPSTGPPPPLATSH